MKNNYFLKTFTTVLVVYGFLLDGLVIRKLFILTDDGICVYMKKFEGVSTPPTTLYMAEHVAEHAVQNLSNFSDSFPGTMNQMNQMNGNPEGQYGHDLQNSELQPAKQHSQMLENSMINQNAHQQTMASVPSMPPMVLYGQTASNAEAQPIKQHSQMLENQMLNQNVQHNVQQQTGPTVPPMVPPPSYLQSLPSHRMNEHTYQQNLSMNSESTPPQWAMQILQTMNSTCARLTGIEREMKAQNTKWENVDYALNTQNSRISNIEEQLHETKGVKRCVSKLQVQMSDLGRDFHEIQGQMNQYDTSMEHYNEQYENLIGDRTRIDNALYDLSRQIKDLQNDYNDMQIKQTKTESKVIDLQCRSMCENLIFSGIDEEIIEKPDGTKYEDSELVLKKFLSKEMDISFQIEFDRVHRLGPIRTQDSDQDEEEEIRNPRPLIAKFERYKDKQYVKMLAPSKLQGKKYGVNEQFPKEIEETRKTLYGEMKKAKRNPENKVRMVRDKLYVNNVQITPKSGNERLLSERNRTDTKYRKNTNRNYTYDKGSRVFYSRNGSSSRTGGDSRTGKGAGPSYQVDFPPLPSSSSFDPFARYETPMRANMESRKKKAVSPLEEELRLKRQNRDSNTPDKLHSEHSDMELSHKDAEIQLNDEQTNSPKTTTVQPEHHTTDTTEQSIQSEFQSGVNQPGVNSDNDSISDL